ncbi:MAG: glutamine--fructose-6-phosphate transaminase (isomerizing) [Gammaproteobacteria bacterium]|nr:glutamine--fructose-6-phosphate transaminase (isomerizing) [Gammaproteobacteria bacterium]
MCGIVGAIAQRNVSGILIEGLNRLEYRGYDSAGLALYAKEKVLRLRRAGKVAQLEKAIAEQPISGNLGIAHTRWATHGIPNEDNAHPHFSQDNDIAVVHNGIITNFEPIKQSLIETGYGFASDTDTEVIAHLIHSFRKQGMGLRHAVQAAVVQCEGAYALGVIDRNEPDKLITARKGSPLVVGVGLEENYIASDQLALLQVTDRFMFLEEGDVAQLELNRIQVWDAAGEPVERDVVRYEHGDQSSDKGQYKHYMAKEIHEQPMVIGNIISDRSDAQGAIHIPLNADALAKLQQASQVLIIACGTSYYAGLVARYWIESVAEISCQVEIASEFRYRKPVVAPGTLFVTLSQSGETADTLAALRHVDKTKLVAAMTICNVPSSSMVRESDFALLTQAGPEIGVASTKAFTTQLLALLQLTLTLAKTRASQDTTSIMQAMQSLPGLLNQVVQYEDKIEQLAQRFADKNHALFLGRGALYPIAMEGALKLKEISYIHAEAYPAGELKHGPLALVDAEMPVVVVAPNDDLLDKLKANMQEVRARGGELFVFADSKATLAADDATHIIALPEVHELLAPILYTIPLQLLSYHVALIKGTDVDQPRNLAKSVTVE